MDVTVGSGVNVGEETEMASVAGATVGVRVATGAGDVQDTSRNRKRMQQRGSDERTDYPFRRMMYTTPKMRVAVSTMAAPDVISR
jgi:hypothetical protein